MYCVRSAVLTSIHIDVYDVEVRDTKLGREEFTSDIPNVSERALVNLDEHGIVRIGTRVQQGDILVGVVSGDIQSLELDLSGQIERGGLVLHVGDAQTAFDPVGGRAGGPGPHRSRLDPKSPCCHCPHSHRRPGGYRPADPSSLGGCRQ